MFRSVWRATGLIASANAVALALQFLTTVLIARTFGATARMDAYTLAVSIPESLQYVLMLATLSVVFTPLFIDARTQHGERDAWSMALSLLVIVTGGVILLLPVLFVLMPWIMFLLAPGFSDATRALAIELGNLILPGLLYYATAGLLLGICYAYHDFVTAALNTFLVALLNLMAFLFFVQYLGLGVQGMMVGRLLVLLLLEIFLLWRVWRHKRGLAVRVRVTDRRAWHLLTYLPPYLFGSLSWQIELFVTRSLISTLGAGSVAAWGYGQRFADIPLALFGAAIGTTYLPDFAAQVADKHFDKASTQFNRTIQQILLILTPIAALLIVLAVPLIALLFQRGAFDAVATQQSAMVLAGLALGLPLRGVGGLIVRGMPAFKSRTLPIFLSALSTGATVAGALLLLAPLGLFGVAFGASLGDSLFTIAGTIVFWRWLQTQAWSQTLWEGGKIALASIGAGGICFLALQSAPGAVAENPFVAQFLTLAVSGMCGLLAFMVLVFVLRVRIGRAVLAMIYGRMRRVTFSKGELS